MEAFSRHGVSGLNLVHGLSGSASFENGPITPLSIRARQRTALENMLAGARGADSENGSLSADADTDGTPEWKVLVYDSAGRDIIAPLLRVADLRALGVTLHLSLDSARQAIPEVAAVYLVAPTLASVQRVSADCAAGLYDSFALHFTSRLPRELLETLAEGVARAGARAALRVVRVFDMYTDFVALEPDLFALNAPGVYAALNDTAATGTSVDAAVTRVVDGLFCAVATLGAVPVIRAQRAGAAEMVATQLEARIRETLVARNNVFAEAARAAHAPPTRPLLVIVDRAVDVPVMLHHTWTYQALAHDTLGLRLNRVRVPVRDDTTGAGAGFGAAATRVFDLDKRDAFWAKNAGLPFPMVAEAVEGALQAYKMEVAKLNTSAVSANALGAGAGDEADAATRLAAAVQNIPELRKRKQMIDLHTNIATALLDQIKERGLDGYFQVEEELLQRPNTFNVERIVALITSNRGTPDDKLRLFLIYFLCVDAPPPAHLSKCVEALRSAGVSDLRAYNFLKSIKAFTANMAALPEPPSAPSGALGAVGAVGGMYAASVLGTLSQVADNVNRLILAEDNARAAAHVVHTLMEQRGDQAVLDGYLLLDPKAAGASDPTGAARRSFREAILFVVGPGNYVEYQNCRDHVCATLKTEAGVKRHVPNGKTLIYGATELCTGVEFLEQLHALAGPKNPVPNAAPPT